MRKHLGMPDEGRSEQLTQAQAGRAEASEAVRWAQKQSSLVQDFTFYPRSHGLAALKSFQRSDGRTQATRWFTNSSQQGHRVSLRGAF